MSVAPAQLKKLVVDEAVVVVAAADSLDDRRDLDVAGLNEAIVVDEVVVVGVDVVVVAVVVPSLRLVDTEAALVAATWRECLDYSRRSR